nr:PREDICTED: nucleophosmin-like [Latimeria chalumnae]|eukprot:XP_005988298.1 PREDICTED: nucleophosmin-like [Latimeria chalumnae]
MGHSSESRNPNVIKDGWHWTTGAMSGVTAGSCLNQVKGEGSPLNYEGRSIKIVLASLKISVQATESLGGFAITPPLVLRLKSGSGPAYASGQHLVAFDEDLELEEDDILEIPKKPAATGTASVTLQGAQNKVKLEEEDDDSEDEEYDWDSEEVLHAGTWVKPQI